MDTSLLRCFLTVSDTQSFSVAAARLNVTQSTVSHQIARLEEHLGKQLFERTTRNCRITADGRDLIPYAARVLQTVDEMEQNFKPRLISGTVMIGVPDDYCLFDPITEALRGFMTDKPGVAVEMKAGLAANHVRDLRDRNLDLAVVREVGEGSGEILRSERIVWIAGHKWAPPSDGVFQLAAVDGGCAYRKAAMAALDERGLTWKCKFSCTSLQGVLSVVRAGLAISVVAIGDANEGVRIIDDVTILPSLPMTTLSIKYADKEPSLASRALARTMANALARI
ncbi:LysR family transcriptional regulator [Sinorhizobium medicae]|uniref:LysR family transcriptional regulator n=1 Tax=Sinorhizobium medicae TaxID=110321 RepID=UPI001295112D|nr:LysR family transcriptional regulator [Sinorhizobium medicae]MDX0967924.1 LysR family transcriptional regulator [Sinorhizobium medicae]MQV49717.1 LysR family transcriptional regulator [Sinorhizobium medicae]MQV52635.1 LysR family transcriptional regulator [Sinorhizobium medicae]MQV75160.1 LysR family transcriptional regulator [Sinorhizobium medicae]WQO88482.1 LysR family transcriptional regulator [Sinorhizobium medicae]